MDCQDEIATWPESVQELFAMLGDTEIRRYAGRIMKEWEDGPLYIDTISAEEAEEVIEETRKEMIADNQW
jgi:hypothetical protein